VLVTANVFVIELKYTSSVEELTKGCLGMAPEVSVTNYTLRRKEEVTNEGRR